VITTVIGLCSGLSVIIRFLSPWIIKFILRYCRQQQQQITSIETIEQQGKKKYFIEYLSYHNSQNRILVFK
jgi:hypothetical protein